MKTALLTFPLLLSTLLASTGCGSDKQRTVYVIEEDPYADDPYEPDPVEPEPDPFMPPFETFEIPIAQSITVGAFVLQLDSALVLPRQTPDEPYAEVVVDFSAHNSSTELATPFEWIYAEGRVLEAGGEYFFGDLEAAAVPGLRDSEGTLFWTIDVDLTPELLAAAVLTFGEADKNQVIVPLAAPAEATVLADIPLQAFTMASYRKTTLEVTSAYVEYSSRGDNDLLPMGTAYLVLEGVVSADPDLEDAELFWDDENLSLLRPDGTSVAPRPFFAGIWPGDRQDVALVFKIEQPVAGTYVFGVTAPNNQPVSQTIVIP